MQRRACKINERATPNRNILSRSNFNLFNHSLRSACYSPVQSAALFFSQFLSPTRYYGVLASLSPHRRYLPEKPTPIIDTEHGADGQDSGLPSAGPSDKKSKPRKRKRIPWVQLLKRTFKIDALKCDKCAGRMKLVAEGTPSASEKTQTPRLVRSPKLTKVGGSLPFSPPVPQIERESGEVERRRRKIEEKYGH